MRKTKYIGSTDNNSNYYKDLTIDKIYDVLSYNPRTAGLNGAIYSEIVIIDNDTPKQYFIHPYDGMVFINADKEYRNEIINEILK